MPLFGRFFVAMLPYLLLNKSDAVRTGVLFHWSYLCDPKIVLIPTALTYELRSYFFCKCFISLI